MTFLIAWRFPNRYGWTWHEKHAGLVGNASFDCACQVLRANTNDEVWSTQRRVTTDASGDIEPVGPLEIVVPAEEGVYDLWVRLTSVRRFSSPFA